MTCVVPIKKKNVKAREAPRDHPQKDGSVAEPHVPIKGNYVFANRPASVLPTPQERRQSTPFRDSRALGNNRRKETVCTHQSVTGRLHCHSALTIPLLRPMDIHIGTGSTNKHARLRQDCNSGVYRSLPSSLCCSSLARQFGAPTLPSFFPSDVPR